MKLKQLFENYAYEEVTCTIEWPIDGDGMEQDAYDDFLEEGAPWLARGVVVKSKDSEEGNSLTIKLKGRIAVLVDMMAKISHMGESVFEIEARTIDNLGEFLSQFTTIGDEAHLIFTYCKIKGGFMDAYDVLPKVYAEYISCELGSDGSDISQMLHAMLSAARNEAFEDVFEFQEKMINMGLEKYV